MIDRSPDDEIHCINCDKLPCESSCVCGKDKRILNETTID